MCVLLLYSIHYSSLKDLSSEERFHVELHFSPGVKGVEEEENAPTGFGFRPASAEVARQVPAQSALLTTADVLICMCSLFASHSEWTKTNRPRKLGGPLAR